MIKEMMRRFKKNLTISDVAFTKLAVFFFTLWLVTVISLETLAFVLQNRIIWFVLFILFAIKPIYKIFKK